MDGEIKPFTESNFANDFWHSRQCRPFPWQLEAAKKLDDGWPPLSYISLATGCGKTSIVDIWHSCSRRRRLIYVINRRVVVDSVFDYAEKLPVKVHMLRGGLSPDQKSDWWLYPEGRQVLVSTIDQAGSALLGQAYGQSAKSAPVLQGLVGTDALWVLDEAHLETPFAKTLIQCQEAGADIDIVLMSATPQGNLPSTIPVIGLSDADKQHPVISKRLRPDRIKRTQIKGKGPLALADEAKRLRLEEGSSIVLIVCNTVATARKTYKRLHSDGSESVLITGRVRPADRGRQLELLIPRIGSGTRIPGKPREPLYVVATSAIEVGADFDCDGLVSEKCSDASQTQREGRVNRLGELDYAPVSILAAESKFTPKAPVLPLWLPTDLSVSFDPDPWLHGYYVELNTVNVVWRNDIPKLAQEQEEYFEALPIMSTEAMPVPWYSFREWIGVRPYSILDRGTVVVSTEYGGADEWGWDAEATVPVADVADIPGVRMRLEKDDPIPDGMVAKEYLEGRLRVAYVPRQWSLGHSPVFLAKHLRSVGNEAAALAIALGFDPALLKRAGRMHDIGKADEAFQLLLGGDEMRLLAKSDPDTKMSPTIAGVPKGWRHEFASMQRIIGRCEPLLVYLVGTHHGHGRPWFPPPHETPIEWVELVLSLREKYSPWTLAAMEAVLRIADWRVSMRGE